MVSNGFASTTSSAVTVTVNGPPAITTQPSNQTIFATQTLSLSVAASGASLTYQWRKNGSAIGGATSASYAKANAVVGDAGNYDVVVTNPAGSATSATAVVVVNGPPVITVQPAGQTIFAGQTLSLSVTATGVGLGYQWRRNGTNLPGATASAYTKANAVVGDAGSYDVVVSNGAGSVTSTAATVVVNGPPAITTQPANQTVFAGQGFSLSVAATGAGTLTYQWRQNGANLSGATAATYSQASAAVADSGNYDVLVTNGAGSTASATAMVTVNGPPVVTTQPANQTVFATQTINLSVAASGAGLTYQWRFNGAAIGGATAQTYSKSNATLGDAGNYDVVVTNPAGSATSSAAVVTVNGPPAISTQPMDQTVFATQSFALSVTASGSQLTYQWRHGGSPVAGANNASYTVSSAALADAGSYDVVVQNPAGVATSAAATVTVNGPPSVTTQPANQTTFATQSFSLVVAASGLSLSYQWRQNGAPIGGATSATFTNSNASLTDAGNYDVVVTNPAGSATSAAATVTVNGPPLITAQPASQTLFATQAITLSVTAGGAGLGYQWRRNGAAIALATSSSYGQPNAAVGDAGTYDVVVTNPAGSVTSSAAVITVNGPPQSTAQPADQTLFAGQSIDVSVAASGSSLNYQWRSNGVELPGATSSVYTKSGAAVADSGSYDVVITNPAGSITSGAAAVVVNGPPVITVQPVGETIAEGRALALSVTAGGAGLQYQWRKGGAAIAGATQAAYQNPAAALSDSGSYDVVVSNPAGSVTSAAATVTVDICLADADCGSRTSGLTCQANTCVPGCGSVSGRNSCQPGYSCDAATLQGACKPDYIAGGCASAQGANALAAVAFSLLLLARRRRRTSPAIAIASSIAVALIALSAAPARADGGFAADRFEPAPSGSDWLRLDSLEIAGNLRLAAGLTAESAHDSLVLRNGSDNSQKAAVLRNQTVLHLGASVVLLDRLRFGLAMPVASFQNGESATLSSASFPAPSSVAAGDLALLADVLLFGAGGPVRAAAGLTVHLPTGKPSSYTGDGTMRIAPRLSLAGDASDFAWAGQLSLETNRAETGLGDTVTTRAGVAAAAGLRLLEQRLLIGPELSGSAVLFQGARFHDARSSPLEALLGAHYRFPLGWQVGGGVGAGLSSGAGAPGFRILAALQWSPAQPKPAPSALMVQEEPKPTLAKEEPPRAAALAAPEKVAEAVAVKEEPPPLAVQPEKAPEPEAVKEPPPPPAAIASVEKKPEPPPPEAALFDEGSVTRNRFGFQNASAKLTPESDEPLGRVQRVLVEHPEVERVEIAGHTSRSGSAQYNQRLSLDRARAVRRWLIRHGIAAGRLIAVGYGFAQPKASNDTEEGQRQNRRVELKVLKLRNARKE